MDKTFLAYGNVAPVTVPSTPPFTPLSSDRPFRRSVSPASTTSLQPTETISPAKAAGHGSVQDTVKVEELMESDAGYVTDLDIVYPEELEEAESDISTNSGSSDNNDCDVGISKPFSRLECQDGEDIAFEKKRRAKHARKRTDSRTFKRAHSTSVKSDADVSDDPDALGDQDRPSSARRLRRRIDGPNDVQVVYDDAFDGSPIAARTDEAYSVQGADETESSSDGMMDIDDV